MRRPISSSGWSSNSEFFMETKVEIAPAIGKLYEPPGKCIYCGKDAASNTMTDEHILAYGLGGNAVFDDASCKCCAKMTGRFEQICLRNLLIQSRTHLGIQTRRPKQRPDKLPVGVKEKSDDDNLNWLTVPVREHPFAIVLPVLEPPGFLVGRAPQRDFKLLAISSWQSPGYLERAAKIGKGKGVATLVRFESSSFARTLAKTAHAFVAAELGLANFTPLILATVFGTEEYMPSYVGSADLPPTKTGHLHLLELRFPNPGQEFISVMLRLFAKYELPAYEVIVGRPLSKQI